MPNLHHPCFCGISSSCWVCGPLAWTICQIFSVDCNQLILRLPFTGVLCFWYPVRAPDWQHLANLTGIARMGHVAALFGVNPRVMKARFHLTVDVREWASQKDDRISCQHFATTDLRSIRLTEKNRVRAANLASRRVARRPNVTTWHHQAPLCWCRQRWTLNMFRRVMFGSESKESWMTGSKYKEQQTRRMFCCWLLHD